MDWEVGFALLLSGFCIVAPTLLYVGLVRGLDRLRDDPFVERVLTRADDEVEFGRRPAETSGLSLLPPRSAEGSDRGTRAAAGAACSRCGAPNPTYAEFCDVCLGRLSNG